VPWQIGILIIAGNNVNGVRNYIFAYGKQRIKFLAYFLNEEYAHSGMQLLFVQPTCSPVLKTL
jgi:hypothetical protein